jgi:hypothetical protein
MIKAMFYLAAGVVIMHGLVLGVFFWWFAGQRPTFGVKGLHVHAAAPAGIYLPRNQHIIVGIAPLVLLTLVGLLLMVIVPAVAISIISPFIAFNAAGAAGGLVMAVRLFSYSPGTLMQDSDTGVVVYGPVKNQSAVQQPETKTLSGVFTQAGQMAR